MIRFVVLLVASLLVLRPDLPDGPAPTLPPVETGEASSLLVVLAALTGVVAVLVRGTSRGRAPAVAGHAHGGRRAVVARHEAGHAVAARALGGRVLSAEMHDDGGGLVTWDMPAHLASPRRNVTFLRAGRYAAGTSQGCGGDRATERRLLRAVPRGDRAAVTRAADQDARRIVRTRRGEIRRDARTLQERGRL